uniref:Uncharacterized protein n=1 Tax=Anguilla anguilla TaxID=7936 RepID=A0A0E9S784_ANGAN
MPFLAVFELKDNCYALYTVKISRPKRRQNFKNMQ